MIYNKNNLIINEICADEKSGRPEISGVKFKKDRTIATDSFLLLQVKNPESMLEMINNYPALPDKSEPYTNFTNKGVIIPAKSVKKVLNNIPKKSEDLPVLKNAIFLKPKDPEISEIATTDLDNVDKVLVKNIKGNYPDVDSIIQGNYNNQVKINVNYLKKMATILSKMDIKDDIITMKIKGKENPIKFEAETKENQEITGLLMPVKQ